MPYAAQDAHASSGPLPRTLHALRGWSPEFSARTFALTLLGSAVLGCAGGFAWDQLAPHLTGTVAGPDQVSGGVDATTAYFGAEAWFVGITLVSGVLCALVLFAVAGTRGAGGLTGLLGLALGGGLGALITWRVGYALGPHSFSAADVGSPASVGLDVHAYGVLLCWPIAATVVHFALTAGLGDEDSRTLETDGGDGSLDRGQDAAGGSTSLSA